MNRHPSSFRHENALRWSLLGSLGLLSLACGGVTQGRAEDDGGTNQGASANQGGAASQGGSTNQGGSASGGSAACSSPVTNPITGLVSCLEGFSHRPSPKVCGIEARTIAPPGSGVPARLPRADGSVECSADASVCTTYELGYCDQGGSFGGPSLPTCRSGCVVDDDCGAGQACLCGDAQSPSGGVCSYVDCRVDGDCPGGELCASVSETCGPGGFACTSPRDACTSDADCGGVQCVLGFEPDRHRQCGSGVVCGRPFLVEAMPRLPPVAERGDWRELGAASPSLEQLSLAERSALAAHFTRLGQLEHASIAAFARFSLQLLSLGAPSDLVEACTQALADETAHAKLCFHLASAYAGHAIGPGPLDVQRSLEHGSLSDIVDLVIVEGCFGETGAALDALAAAENAADPVIRGAYSRIAVDEQRHAELAFRFVRWALEHDAETVHQRIEAALGSPLSESSAARLVSVPCLQALLGSAGSLSAPAQASS